MLAQGPADALAGHWLCASGARGHSAGRIRAGASPFTPAMGHRHTRVCTDYRGPDVMEGYQTSPALANAVERRTRAGDRSHSRREREYFTGWYAAGSPLDWPRRET